MSEIIVQGHKIDTKDIWDITHVYNTREVWVTVKVTGHKDIVIGRRIPYETCTGQFGKYWNPYEKLYNELKEKWEADKTDIPTFKI